MCATLSQLQNDVAADPAAAADDHRDLAAEFALRRHSLELGFLERPILDSESLAGAATPRSSGSL